MTRLRFVFNTENSVENLESWIQIRHRNLLKSLDSIDNALLLLSASGFFFSICFIDNTVKLVYASHKLLLKGCWFSLGLSLILILIAQFTKHKGNIIESDLVEEEYSKIRHSKDNSGDMLSCNRLYLNCFGILTNILRFLAVLLLISGIVLLVVFVVINN